MSMGSRVVSLPLLCELQHSSELYTVLIVLLVTYDISAVVVPFYLFSVSSAVTVVLQLKLAFKSQQKPHLSKILFVFVTNYWLHLCIYSVHLLFSLNIRPNNVFIFGLIVWQNYTEVQVIRQLLDCRCSPF